MSSIDWPAILRILGAVVAVWVVSRLSHLPVRWVLARHDRRASADPLDTAVLTDLKRRETIATLLQTSVRYVAVVVAGLYIAAQVTTGTAVTAIAGASLLVLIVGFAAQRFLTDVLTGAVMLFEGWFSVGDTITVEPWKLEGVVEEVALRATTIRSPSGEQLRVHNSQVLAVRVIPRGVRELAVELFCTDEDQGRELLDAAAKIMPVGPLQLIRPPHLVAADQLGDQLYRLRAQAAAAAGSEWVVRDFLPGVIKEMAPVGLIVHGPVVLEASGAAENRYARSLGLPR